MSDAPFSGRVEATTLPDQRLWFNKGSKCVREGGEGGRKGEEREGGGRRGREGRGEEGIGGARRWRERREKGREEREVGKSLSSVTILFCLLQHPSLCLCMKLVTTFTCSFVRRQSKPTKGYVCPSVFMYVCMCIYVSVCTV